MEEILNYSYIYKPKRYDKPIIKIFTKIYFLYKRLKVRMTIGRDLFDIIEIVIIFDTLHSDFEALTTSIF